MRTQLSEQDIRTIAPSVFTEVKDPSRSDKYSFVSTKSLLNNFEKLGWVPVKVTSVRSKKRSPEYSRHMIRLAHISNLNVSKGEIIPEIIINNSHNGSSPLSINMGLYRMVCGNGLMVATMEFANFKKRHMGFSFEELQDIIVDISRAYTSVIRKLETYKQILLDNNQQRKFAQEAIDLIYNERSNRFEATDFLVPVRIEDEQTDVFTIMNRIQEHLMKGGITPKQGRKTREVKGIHSDILINSILWKLMENYTSKS